MATTSAFHLHAGFVHFWTVQELQDAPVLAVATVESVEKREPVPPERTRSKLPERYWEAELRIHRSYSRLGQGVGALITVRYISFGDLNAGGVLGYPIWPRFEVGQTAVFALAPGDRGLWRLVADEGENLTVPALVTPAIPDALRSGRTFILAELANTLANGNATSRYASAVFLREPGGWPDGLREVLERDIGTNDDRWLEVACALLASLGIPHPTVAELVANPNLPGSGNQAAAWALAKGAKREYPNRLIRYFLRNMPEFEWGAGNELLEFKDSPLVVAGMKDLLSRDPAGSIYVAWVLVRNGQHAFLTEALDAAVTLASTPESVSISRLQASSELLRDFGSERQFNVIPDALRRLKYKDEDTYRKLFGSVSYSQNQRELRVAAVLIDDRRPGFGALRYCDVAAYSLQRLSGQSFGIAQEMTREERDRAVADAADWLRRHLRTPGGKDSESSSRKAEYSHATNTQSRHANCRKGK